MNKTPAKDAAILGLDSLAQMVKATGQSRQTLSNWHKNKPELFKIVVLGTLAANNTKDSKQ